MQGDSYYNGIIMQGDSYYLGIEILNNAGNPVTPDDVNDVEIVICRLRKTYKNAELIYREGLWLFPLSQQNTLNFYPSAAKGQVSVVWKNGVKEGRPLYGIRIIESISKEVL